MININNNNSSNNKSLNSLCKCKCTEVASLTGDLISPSFGDATKILLIKTHSQNALFTLVMILVRPGRAFNKNSHYIGPSQLICFVDQWNGFYTRQIFTEW